MCISINKNGWLHYMIYMNASIFLYPNIWTCIREAPGDGTMTVCLGTAVEPHGLVSGCFFGGEQFGTNATGVCTKMCPGGILMNLP